MTCIVLGHASEAFALGFILFEQGASGTGVLEARTALADDPNTVFYNPAGMCELEGFQLGLGLTGVTPTVTYSPSAEEAPEYLSFNYQKARADNFGNSAASIPKLYTIPHLYLTYRFEKLPLAIGLGSFAPNGLGVAWPDDFDGRFMVTEAYMGALFNQPVIALDIARLAGFKDRLKLSVAAGYALVAGMVRLSRFQDLRAAEPLLSPQDGAPSIKMNIDGMGLGHGWNLALYAELPGLLAFGFSFRSGLELSFDGEARLYRYGAAQRVLDLTNRDIPGKTDATVEIKTPHFLNTGLAYLGLPRWKLLLDLELALYQGRYENIDISFSCYEEGSAASCALPPVAIERDWRLGGAVNAGAEYLLRDTLPLRFGLGLTFSPIPDGTWDPSAVDDYRYSAGVGLGYRAARWKVDVAYAFFYFQHDKQNLTGAPAVLDEAFGDLTSPNGTANGMYRTHVHVIALSTSVKF